MCLGFPELLFGSVRYDSAAIGSIQHGNDTVLGRHMVETPWSKLRVASETRVAGCRWLCQQRHPFKRPTFLIAFACIQSSSETRGSSFRHMPNQRLALTCGFGLWHAAQRGARHFGSRSSFLAGFPGSMLDSELGTGGEGIQREPLHAYQSLAISDDYPQTQANRHPDALSHIICTCIYIYIYLYGTPPPPFQALQF